MFDVKPVTLRVSTMNAELAELRRLLEEEKVYRIEVEEERDFLLRDNDRLRQELAALQHKSTLFPNMIDPVSDKAFNSSSNVTASVVNSQCKPIDKLMAKIDNASGGKNVVACSVQTLPSSDGDGDATNADVVLCGGVDNAVSAYTICGSLLFTLPMPAPVISMDCFADQVLCGMMDGSHSFFRLERQGDAVVALPSSPLSEVADGQELACSERKHTKQVVLVKWSEDGQYACTLSHDKQVILYKRSVKSGVMEMYQTVLCATTPESAAFVHTSLSTGSHSGESDSNTVPAVQSIDCAEDPEEETEPENMEEFVSQLLQKSQRSATTTPPPPAQSAATIRSAAADTGNVQLLRPSLVTTVSPCVSSSNGVQHELVLGVRGVPYLTYINCTTLVARTVSLNEHSWDTHVSFTPLYLSPSPFGDRLLVATDKHMHIVLKTSTNVRLQVLSGHSCGHYGKPVVLWDRRGEYIYCNSDDDNTVKVYSTLTGKIVNSLVGHGKGIVRCLAAHKTAPVLVSGSYDKSVIVWGV